jgi:hypothetical protein
MLIHVTRFKATQKQVYQYVSDELRGLKQRLQEGDGARLPALVDVLREQWDTEFEPKLAIVQASITDPRMTPLSWSDIEPHLKDAALKIDTRLINGEAGDVLDYMDNPNGLSVIAIGGEKLSRGLTLEGLSVSYYLRAAKMYDTLMQMGRWFGYRPGYADLCRLYTSQELVGWYEHITMASEELREEFNRMADAGATPKEFGLRVQTHPDGMTITAINKMRSGQRMRVSFAGTLNESYAFHKDIGVRRRNWATADAFVRSCGEPLRDGNRLVWKKIAGSDVAQFLDSFEGHPSSRHKDMPQKLAEYIRKKVSNSEIREWTVALMTGRGVSVSLGGHEISMVQRSQEDDALSQDTVYTVTRRHLISGSDEEIDLTKEQVNKALIRTREERKSRFPEKPEAQSASGVFLRYERPKENGLLLIYPLDPNFVDTIDKSVPFVGFAASFPDTDYPHEAVEYMVNNVYWQEEFGQ